MSPDEFLRFSPEQLKKVPDLELLGMLASLLGQKSRLEQTKVTHPDLWNECQTATKNQDVSAVKAMPPDALILLNANVLETFTKLRMPKGPVARLIFLAEWLNEHPTVMMEIVADPRWDETV